MPSRFLIVAIAAVCGSSLVQNRAVAHDLQGRVTLHPDAIVIEAWFSDDTPAQGATIAIIDVNGNEVASGKTDDRGMCRLPRLSTGHYTAVIELIGHRETIPFEDVRDSSGLEFSSFRLNKTLGLTIGVGVLLGAWCMFWLVRKRGTGRVVPHDSGPTEHGRH
jgi:nickel transport protein